MDKLVKYKLLSGAELTSSEEDELKEAIQKVDNFISICIAIIFISVSAFSIYTGKILKSVAVYLICIVVTLLVRKFIHVKVKYL